MRRVVLDTNVFVSSVLVRSGQPAEIIRAWRAQRFLLLVSPAILKEVERTLNYPHIRRKYPLQDGDVQDLLASLKQDALVVPGISSAAGAVPEDPDDEAILACALDGGADTIVSGDRHLLALESYRGVRVLRVREFIEELGPGGT
jgi:putative PIN family toxin of toxin-antitoxin system